MSLISVTHLKRCSKCRKHSVAGENPIHSVRNCNINILSASASKYCFWPTQAAEQCHLDLFLGDICFFSGSQCRCAWQRYDGLPAAVLYVDLCPLPHTLTHTHTYTHNHTINGGNPANQTLPPLHDHCSDAVWLGKRLLYWFWRHWKQNEPFGHVWVENAAGLANIGHIMRIYIYSTTKTNHDQQSALSTSEFPSLLCF